MKLYNIGSQPELKEKILSGEIFLAKNTAGEVALNTEEALYHDPQGKFMCWLNPSEQALAGAASIVTSVEGYTFRIADTPGELIEKIRIRDAGFDDIVMELCKYASKLDLRDSMKDSPELQTILDAELRFFRTDGADGELQFAYAGKERMQMIAVPLSMYENARAIVARNPVFKEKATGFVRIDAQWLSDFIR